MPEPKQHSLPLSLLALLGVALAGVSASSSPSASSAANSDEAELICHTSNPAECYPKIFQPTSEFQVVHPDQDLPTGLHVRLNIYTGQKEAKINVPDEAVDSSLEGLPVDTSIVIVDPQEDSLGSEEQGQPLKPLKNAPVYDPDGKIKEPRKETAESQEEGSAFYKSLTILKKGLDVDQALEMLEEISHDIYYGLKIAEDYDTVRELFCLANSPSVFTSQGTAPEKDLTRSRLAALTISSAVQNNPKALAEISKHWTAGLQQDTCTKSKSQSPGSEPLQISTFRLLPSSSSSPSVPASLTKARISAISGLLKSPSIRQSFLSANGIDLLLQVLLDTPSTSQAQGEEWEKVRRQAGHLILDNFLDEDMGAVLGEWPDAVRDVQASDKECASRAKSQGDEKKGQGQGDCWDWHAKQLADRYKKEGKGGKGHWSWELWNRLKEQRKNASSNKKNKGGKKDEL
ncbi:hypothetical protein QBC32DRAFT_349271 [Pseudoneurospora amorphoporcata]|uniref:Nucleotide exchange factor SIL1 n=1 Tax=Pseudoneurospora amorphoporcata TaxID=241081 RepID=A0AAN6NNY1_9PEZI|nr:hypothetical protein QBC32DRAFT_349271 [Pseudoneurospora amorphoporcata]